MIWQDALNGAYELLAGGFVLNHARVLYQHKEVKGVSASSTAFFTSWGFWNLYYYPFLGQWLSFVGGLSIVAANVTWLGMMLYYINNPGGNKTWNFQSQSNLERAMQSGFANSMIGRLLFNRSSN